MKKWDGGSEFSKKSGFVVGLSDRYSCIIFLHISQKMTNIAL